MTDNNNICNEAFTLLLSTYNAIKQMAQLDVNSAFEYFAALADYNFYGKEYSGSNIMIKIMAEQQYPLIDKQNERYNKAIKAGQSKQKQIPWEDIEAAARTGKFDTYQALGVHFGTSGQNIGRRFKTKGLTLADLIETSDDVSFENSEPFETIETKSSNFHSPETNPKNKNKSNNVCFDETKQANSFEEVTTEAAEPSWQGKVGTARIQSLV